MTKLIKLLQIKLIKITKYDQKNLDKKKITIMKIVQKVTTENCHTSLEFF